jgi:ANTAR domain
MEADAEARLEQLATEAEQLRTALATRIIIEQAKGALSVVLKTPPEEVFEVLRRQARSERRDIHELAAEVVADPWRFANRLGTIPLTASAHTLQSQCSCGIGGACGAPVATSMLTRLRSSPLIAPRST